MARTPNPTPDFGEDMFDDEPKQPVPASAGLKGPIAPPPPPPPRTPAVSAPVIPAAVPTVEEPAVERPAAAPKAPAAKAAPAVAETPQPPVVPEDEPTTTVADIEHDPVESLPEKVDAKRAAEAIDAVFAMIQSSPDLLPGAVQRLATATDGDPAYVNALLERIYEAIPPAGKFAEPLDVAPHLHQKVKAEVARQRRRGEGATVTTVVLEAVGEAHAAGKIPALIEGLRGGARRKVPVFGNLTVGTAPRGAAVKMQFAPDARSRMMLDVFTAWYRVQRVKLVRLVLEDRYRREPRKNAGESTTDAPADTAAIEVAS